VQARELRVRAAVPSDLDRAAALATLLFAAHAAEGGSFAIEPGREGELRELLAACLGDPDRALLVAEPDGGSLVGFVAVGLRRRPGPFAERVRGSVDWLFVREEVRRDGIGRALVDAGLAWLRAQGAERVELEVARANDGAQAFWRALGFLPRMDVLERPL
jgi:ribosomal protein S18 acetylase RimI-like enzyme